MPRRCAGSSALESGPARFATAAGGLVGWHACIIVHAPSCFAAGASHWDSTVHLALQMMKAVALNPVCAARAKGTTQRYNTDRGCPKHKAADREQGSVHCKGATGSPHLPDSFGTCKDTLQHSGTYNSSIVALEVARLQLDEQVEHCRHQHACPS
jgi:hypothetical protein